MEPTLRGVGDTVIYSPTTAVMETQVALDCLMKQLNCLPKFDAETGVKYITMDTQSDDSIKVRTNKGDIYARFMINAAGQGALDIAQQFGHGQDLISVPIKGRYAISSKPLDQYKMLVYPVPVKGALVLGVHSTYTVDGRVKVGPTVFPAFAQENYDYF